MPLAPHFAALADIHGNADALRAVLADIDARAIPRAVNLGDVFSGPLAAEEVWDILQARPMLTVRGNHDRYLIEQAPSDMAPSDRVAHDRLPRAAMDWLRSLPQTISDQGILLCHATPADDQTYWLDTVDTHGTVQLAGIGRIRALLGTVAEGLVLCAHTHLPRAVALPGGSLIVNPGSVGCPGYTDDRPVPHVVQAGLPHACYAELRQTAAGWQISHHHVPYDPGRMVRLAAAHGRDDWARAVGLGWVDKPV
ncbi:MAG: metallophosphoesterase family protein [Roseivivax sp.]|nr:metallophosphoesterase family protein [Roseivivax sp.]